MRPKSPQRVEAERLCRQFPESPSRTLARTLAKSHNITVDQARELVRACRGNHGTKSRQSKSFDKSLQRPNQPAGWKPKMPESLAEPWEEFKLGNGIDVAVLSDIHIPYHSPVALESAVAFCKKRKPNVLLINGDLADFYSISRHQKDPSKRDLENEITLVREGLEWLRSEFGKKCRIVLKLGNHEERWQHWLWNCAPEISNSPRMTVSEWIDAPKYGIEVVTDQRPVMCGRLTVLHGHELGKSTFSPVNTARGTFMRTLSTMLVGHSHRTSQHSEPDFRHLETCCWSAGCLCGLTPDYAKINKWNYGFAFIQVDPAGEFHVENMRLSVDGKVW